MTSINGDMPIDVVKAEQRAEVQHCNSLEITLTELARRARVDPATLTRFMNTPKYKHALSAKTMHKLRAAAGTVTKDRNRLPNQPSLRNVKVAGVAAA